MTITVDTVGAVRTVRAAAGFDWRWVTSDLSAFAAELGWQVSELRAHGATVVTDFDLRRPVAFAQLDDAPLPGFLAEGQTMTSLMVMVSDFAENVTELVIASAIDQFVELVSALTAEVGAPTHRSPGPVSEVRWDLPKVVVVVAAHENFLAVSFNNPRHQAVMDRAIRNEEDDYSALDDRASGRVEVADRDEFSNALTLLLSRIPGGGHVTLRGSGNRFARFEVEREEARRWSRPMRAELRCEISRNAEMDRVYHLSVTDRAAMVRGGWITPSERNHTNWRRIVGWPAYYAEYRETAGAVTIVLRDLLKFAHPNEIHAEATGLWELSDLDELLGQST